MDLQVREITKQDADRVSACAARLAQEKLRGVWIEAFDSFPLPAHHTGTVVVEHAKNALFTQVPHHWQEMEQEKYLVLLDERLAVLNKKPGFKFALALCSKSLADETEFIFQFAAASLQATGSWMLPSIEPTEFYCESTAFSL